MPINYSRQKKGYLPRILIILKPNIRWCSFDFCGIFLSIILNKIITCSRAKTWNSDTTITSVYTLCPLNFKVIFNGQRSNKMTSLNLNKSINNIFYDYFDIYFFLNSGGNGIFVRHTIFCFIPNWILRRNLKQNVHNR